MGGTLLAIVATTTPFFAVVAAGWWAARRGLVGPAAVGGLNAFVLDFALPAMLLRFGMTLSLAELLHPGVLAVYALAGMVLLLAVVAWARRRMGRVDAAFAALIAVFPNSGFMGLPLLAALLGPASAGPVVSSIAIDMVLTTSVALALGQQGGARRALLGAARNPLAWAIVVGAVLGVSGTRLPAPVLATIDLLAAAASPVALFMIGTVLHHAGRGGAAHADPPVPVWPLVGVKLAAHPLAVALVGWAALRGGWIAPAQWTALVLVAALPSASNVAMLAHRLGAGAALVPRVIMATTVAAFVTFALWAWALGV